MNLFPLGLYFLILSSYCFNLGQFAGLLNLTNINTTDILVNTSNHTNFQEYIYTPKTGVQICKVTDGIYVIWEDRSKLTQCVKGTTITKNGIIQLIHLVIKRTSKVSEDKYYKRLDSKFVNISDKEYDLLKADPNQLTDNSISLDINNKQIDERLFKKTVRPFDGVPTLLLEPLPEYKLVSVHDDFRIIWTKKSSQSCVKNLIAYYFFTKYHLVMLKLEINDSEKYECFMFKDGNWMEVEYYTFMNKFLRLKSHIPITGHLTFNILDLPTDEQYTIEKEEKYSIELCTYYPKRGFHLNSVLKGENIIWESSSERCVSIRLIKKNGAIQALNLSLMDDLDNRTALNFVYQDNVYRSVSDEDFKTFSKNLVDPSEYKKYHEEHDTKEQEDFEEGNTIISEPDSDLEEETVEDEIKVTDSPSKPPFSEDQLDPHLLDISDYNPRLFLRNNFSMHNVDTYEYLCMPQKTVSSIMDGLIPVWNNTNENEKFQKLYVHHKIELNQLLKLVTLVKTGEVLRFFKRQNSSFIEIDRTEYDSLFERLGNSVNPLDNSIVLNLSTTPQEKYFDYHHEFDDGVNVSKFVTKSRFKLSKVVRGNNVLWQSTNAEKCSSITINNFHKSSQLLVLNISGPSTMSIKYFRNSEGDLSEIDQNSYNLEYKNFKNSIPFISYVSLNINTIPNDVKFLCIKHPETKFVHSDYYPKSGYVLNKVMHDSNILWTSTKNRCKQVSVFKFSESEKLVKLSFSTTTTPDLYFNFVKGKFVKLRNFIEFNFTIKDLTKVDSSEDSRSFCKYQLERKFTLNSDCEKILLNTNIDNPNIYTCFNPDLIINKIFVPKDGYVFTNITDGNVILFSSKSDQNLCVYIQVYYDNDGPRLAKFRTMGLQSEGKGHINYIEILDNLTKNLGSQEFENKLREITDDLNKLKEIQNKKLPLNISTGNSESVEKTGKFRGLDYKEFKSNEGFFFSKIIFSEDLVYTLDSEEDCFLVRAYFILDHVLFVELNFVLPGSSTTNLYLYRFGNDFTILDLEQFDNLIKSMSNLHSKFTVLEIGDFDSTNPYEVIDPPKTPDCVLKQKLFSSNQKYFTQINVNNSKIWRANSDLLLTKSVNVYYVGKKPHFLKLSLENLDNEEASLFFELVESSWSPINSNELNDRINKNVYTEPSHPNDNLQESDSQVRIETFDTDIVKKINSEHISYTTGKHNNLPFIEVVPKNPSHGMTSVSDNGNLMWESTKNDVVCKKFLVYYFENIPQLLKLVFLSQSNDNYFEYKHVSNGNWVEIDDYIFSRKLTSFESLSRVTKVSKTTEKEYKLSRKKPIKLDTINPDETLLRLTTTKLNNLSYNQYRPMDNGLFDEVIDNTLIWRSESDEFCNLVRIYFWKNRRVLSKLFISNDLGSDKYLHFSYREGSWKKISSKEFDTKFELYNIESTEEVSQEVQSDNCEESLIEEVDDVKQGKSISLELDINSVDTKSFIIHKGSCHNVPFTKIKIKPNALICQIKDSKSTLWPRNDLSHCTHVKLYHYGTNVKTALAEIIVKSKGSKLKFLRKLNGEWKVIDEDEFNTLYDELIQKYKNNKF